jgi:hypothetical protein
MGLQLRYFTRTLMLFAILGQTLVLWKSRLTANGMQKLSGKYILAKKNGYKCSRAIKTVCEIRGLYRLTAQSQVRGRVSGCMYRR